MSLLSYGYPMVMLRLSFGKGSICIRKRCGNGSERDCKLYGLDGLNGLFVLYGLDGLNGLCCCCTDCTD